MTTPKAGMPEPRVLDDMLNQLEDCINAPCKCGCAGIYPHELRAVSNMLSQKDAEVERLARENDSNIGYAQAKAKDAEAAEKEVDRLNKIVDAYPIVAGKTSDEYNVLHEHYKFELDRAREAEQSVERLTLERDLAIAHDRQPYPTAWAYEQACKTIHQQQIRAEAAEQEVERLRAEVAGLKQELAIVEEDLKRVQQENSQFGAGA